MTPTIETVAPSLDQHLPAIYQDAPLEESGCEGPLEVLMAALQSQIGSVDAVLDGVSDLFDPLMTPALPMSRRTSSSRSRNSVTQSDPEFLAWLGHCVGIDISEVESGVEGESLGARQRRLVKDADALWRIRGTCEGLRAILEALYDARIEIEEWTWPQGMAIGDSSVIGVGTLLVPRADLRDSFVVIWYPPVEFEGVIQKCSRGTTLRRRDGVSGTRQARICVFGEEASESADSEAVQANMQSLLRKALKIRNVIDRERPAHTRCYMVLGWMLPDVRHVPPLQIGVPGHAIMGMSYIS